jgi:alkylated DNA nucleotide flippase Atl1
MVKARETNLEGILEGKKQYQVPLYQRVYSWGKEQIDQLWSDLVEIAETRKSDPSATHFIGSLVLAVSPDTGAVGMQKLLVVDGQQRLTTLTLLLAALRDHQAENGEPEARERIDNQYLVNRYEPGQPPKVLPTQADRTSYEAVIAAASRAGGADRVGGAYRAFRAKIAAADDPEDPTDIRAIEEAVLGGLAVVAVTAERGDNAHRIFESLNNTGLKLTQADLLKNYLFMRLGDRSEAVYRALWRPLESLLSPENLELLFWLDLVQTDEKAPQSETYVGQQRRLERLEAEKIEGEVARIAALGEVLATILDPGRESDPEVAMRLGRIKAWGSTTAYPVVMQLLTRRAAGTASSAQVAEALRTLESYFVRRIIVGRATAGLNRSLLQATAAISEAEDVALALRRYLSMGRRHFATDAQIREAADTVAFYWQGRASQKKLILLWLEESFQSKEPVDSALLTIEHVLPQTLSEEVRHEFVKGLPPDSDVAYEHERIVHTLGNMTLTGYNSQLGNRPYSQKREMLSKSSLRLNQEVVEHSAWTTSEIRARGAALAERVIELWPGPDESLTTSGDQESELRRAIASVVAGVPAGRWTSYGELALVVGSHPVPVGTVLASHPIPNAWRVLQAAGTVSPQFRWLEPGRTDDPIAVLEAEGLRFDESGKAVPEQFLDAADLAEIAGLDVDSTAWARRSGQTVGALGSQQLGFWEAVREYGVAHASQIAAWREPRPKHWYTMVSTMPSASVEMTVNSEEHRVGVELYIHSNKEVFRRLAEERELIERELGLELEWREMPERKASRIVAFRDGDFRDAAEAPLLIEWLVTWADQFTGVFGRRLR